MKHPSSVWRLSLKAARKPHIAVRRPYEWFKLRTQTFELDEVFNIIASVTPIDQDTAQRYYKELCDDVFPRYDAILGSHLPSTSGATIYRKIVGPEKFARVDRFALYCFVRAIKPNAVIETGVKWGDSSFFITEALRKNGHGTLYAFDIGIEGSSTDYLFPDDAGEVGFLLPDQNRKYWELILGDAVEKMDIKLPEISPVDLFYHDSLHTYDHMYAEYETVLAYMSPDGVLMSEDIDANDAWEDFLTDYDTSVQGDFRYYSMHGIDHSTREVGVTTVK